VVFASSNHVVGGKLWSAEKIAPNCEPDFGTRYDLPGAKMDSTLYAAAKVAGEALCRSLVESGRLERVIVWRIGWCQPGENLKSSISVTGTPTIAVGTVDLNDSKTSRVLQWFKDMHLSNRDLDALVDRALLDDKAFKGLLYLNAVTKSETGRWVI